MLEKHMLRGDNNCNGTDNLLKRSGKMKKRSGFFSNERIILSDEEIKRAVEYDRHHSVLYRVQSSDSKLELEGFFDESFFKEGADSVKKDGVTGESKSLNAISTTLPLTACQEETSRFGNEPRVVAIGSTSAVAGDSSLPDQTSCFPPKLFK
jgi:hypothetical protein